MPHIIIVGGGIAGLSAGIYAQQSGFDTTIYEMHTIPGGNSTSWRRKGYLFEGGLHWLTGSKPGTPLHRLWTEVGALQDNNPVTLRDPFFTDMDGEQPIHLYRDPKQLEEHLITIAPADRAAIQAFIKDVRAIRDMRMPISDVKGVKMKHKSPSALRALPGVIKALPRLGKLQKMSIAQYIAPFTHPGIRRLLSGVAGGGETSVMAMLFTVGVLAAADGGYPAGGSLRMAQNMADTYTQLGGRIHYGQHVSQVVVSNAQATGVMIGEAFHPADAVIIAADTRVIIDTLFDAPLNESWADAMRAIIQPTNCTFVSLGVTADLSDLPESMGFSLSTPLTYADQTITHLGFNQYAHYPDYAPAGCTAVTCTLMGDTYDYWKQAQADGTYKELKAQLAQDVIDRMAQVLPQTQDQVAVWDVATPVTYERYCGTYRGSWMSGMDQEQMSKSFPSVSENIRGLYFAGQRLILPGGLPVALMTGRTAVQHLCKDHDQVFQSQVD